MLPMYARSEIDKRRTHSCEVHFNKVLNNLNKKYYKDYTTYRELMKKMRGKKHLHEICLCNESFGIFVNSLPRRT
jgi:hypothetical protein